MSDPDATGSRVQAAARAIHRLQHVYGNEGDDPCDMCLEEAEAALSAADAVDATPDRAAVTVKVYPVEHRALYAALAAVGSPPKLPDWYNALASLWIRIEDAYPDD